MLIGDVSGKGMPAALTMAQILAEFRLFALGSDSPAEVLRQLNDRFVVRSRRGLFCTLAAVAINLRTGNILGANAGHHPLVVVSERRPKTLLRRIRSAHRDPARDFVEDERAFVIRERPWFSTPTASSRRGPA